MTQIKHYLLLLLTATIWGVAFVAQRVGSDYVGPFTFNCIRFLLGGIVLLPFLIKNKNVYKDDYKRKQLIKAGTCCGIFLFSASMFQQIGVSNCSSVGKSGFITAFYILFVPILSFILFKKKNNKGIYFCTILAFIGLYFLCVNEKLQIESNDILLIICAILFSFHILVIDHFVKEVDGVCMSCIQFFVSFLLGLLPMLFMEHVTLQQIYNGMIPIGYAGFLSCGVAYTLQIVGQKGVNPTIASLILSLESLISLLAGVILLNQSLTLREIIGCILMFISIMLSQVFNENK